MAAVFQEIEIQWRGESYRITPTMRLLNSIERDVSLSALAGRMIHGDVPLSILAGVVAAMLRHAGAAADDDDVYMALVHGDEETVMAMASAVIAAAFPEPKKSEAEAKPAPKNPPKRK